MHHITTKVTYNYHLIPCVHQDKPKERRRHKMLKLRREGKVQEKWKKGHKAFDGEEDHESKRLAAPEPIINVQHVYMPESGHSLGALPKSYHYFTLFFEIWPLMPSATLSRIFRIAQPNNKDTGDFADRWLGLWFTPGSHELHFVAGNKGNPNAFVDVDGIEPGQWNSIRIVGMLDFIVLILNDTPVAKLPNKGRPELPKLNVMSGDEFSSPAKANIRNFSFHAP